MRYTKGSAGSDLKAERLWWSWVKLNYNLWPLANKNPLLLTSSIDSACPVPLAMSMGVFPSLFSAKKCKQYGAFRQIWKVETKTSKRTIAIKAQLRTNQNANTFAENAWENKTSRYVMSTRKTAWDAATGGKSRVGIKRGKKKRGVERAKRWSRCHRCQRVSKTDKKELVESI